MNPTQASMLGLFYSGESLTGHDICVRADKVMKPYWSITRSQIYRELPDMVGQGLIKPDNTVSVTRKNAQFYQITQAGKDAFAEWLTSPINDDHTRSNLALRISFAECMDDNQVILIANTNIARAKREIVRLRRLQRTEATPSEAMGLRLAEMQQQTIVQWLNEVKTQVRKGNL